MISYVCDFIISVTLSALFTCAFDFQFLLFFRTFLGWTDARSERPPLLIHFVMEDINFPYRLSTAEGRVGVRVPESQQWVNKVD